MGNWRGFSFNVECYFEFEITVMITCKGMSKRYYCSVRNNFARAWRENQWPSPNLKCQNFQQWFLPVSYTSVLNNNMVRRKSPNIMNKDEGTHYLSHVYDPLFAERASATGSISEQKRSFTCWTWHTQNTKRQNEVELCLVLGLYLVSSSLCSTNRMNLFKDINYHIVRLFVHTW